MDVHGFWERQIIINCYLVQAAVEAWAATNGGIYPQTTGARNPLGRTFIDLLPDGRLLMNPIWLLRDTPVNGMAGASGQVGYLMRDLNGDGVPEGYTIDALTKHHELLLVLTKP
jgi:hypothetical protein